MGRDLVGFTLPLSLIGRGDSEGVVLQRFIFPLKSDWKRWSWGRGLEGFISLSSSSSTPSASWSPRGKLLCSPLAPLFLCSALSSWSWQPRGGNRSQNEPLLSDVGCWGQCHTGKRNVRRSNLQCVELCFPVFPTLSFPPLSISSASLLLPISQTELQTGSLH